MELADVGRIKVVDHRRGRPGPPDHGPALAAGTPGGALGESGQASLSFDGAPCGMATERAGTTVEIACLYTICVTVFLSRTTYWSNDSICPCSLCR